MESRVKYKIAWIIALILLTIMSSTFLFMPFTAEMTTLTYKLPVIIVSCIFGFR